MKRILSVMAISSTLLVASLSNADDKRPVTRPPKQPPQPAQSTEPAVPLTPQQMPPTPPRVSYRDGQLTIVANNSSLGDILKAIHAQTGAAVDIPGSPQDRVFGQFGPGPARDVLSALLNGSHFNYILLGSAASPDELERVILTAKSGGPASAPEPQAAAYSGPQNPMVSAFPMRAPGGNTVVAQPESADDQDTATDDTADTQDDTATDDQTDQTDDTAQSDDQQGDQTDDQSGQAADQAQDPNAQQPAVRTPEQMLQELQQRQQQLMQQQQQGVAPQGVPTPTPPGMVVPGQTPPPH